MTEATTLPISQCRSVLASAGARLVLPQHSDLLRAFDKDETTRLAASLGVSVPKTVLITSMAQATEFAPSVSHPVVLKPRSSEELSDTGAVRTAGGPRYARDPHEFLQAYREISSRTSAVLVQDFVPGEGTGYFALFNQGQLRAEFAHRRIRDVRPTGSGSALRESVKPDPEVREAALAILSALRWHGVAMVEFRKSPGQPPVFMEVNGRFWHSLALACYAGVDFPAMMARLAEVGEVETPPPYRVGVQCRWFLGDIRHLAEVWRGAPLGYPGTYPRKLSTLVSVLKPVPGTYHDLFQWSDPLPELGDWISLAKRLMTKIPSRSGQY
jgi:predicted ATP-grasp superfamily ATP-dependent carboligase